MKVVMGDSLLYHIRVGGWGNEGEAEVGGGV